jgi:hypothetical protein
LLPVDFKSVKVLVKLKRDFVKATLGVAVVEFPKTSSKEGCADGCFNQL